MFVLSVEGAGHLNKRNWTTHVVLGVFDTQEEAALVAASLGDNEDEVKVITEIRGCRSVIGVNTTSAPRNEFSTQRGCQQCKQISKICSEYTGKIPAMSVIVGWMWKEIKELRKKVKDLEADQRV